MAMRFAQALPFDLEPAYDLLPDTAEHPIAPPAELLLIRALVQDVQTAALLTAGAASAVNFAYRHAGTRALHEARDLIADFPASLDHWPRAILEEEVSRDTLQTCADFYDTFREGRHALAIHDKDAEEIGSKRALTLHITGLTSIWRQAARRARHVVAAILAEVTHILPTEYDANARALDRIQADIVDGAHPCCNAIGHITLPQLAERRRSPRKALLQPAVLRTGGAQYQAFARDISAGGIGMTRLPPLAQDLPVLVELASGRSFEGNVAWSHGMDAGIRFKTPLTPTDPLIYG